VNPQVRRTPRHVRHRVRAAIRVRSSSLGLITGVAVVAGLGLVLGGGRAMSRLRTDAAPVRAVAIEAGAAAIRVSAAPVERAAIPDIPWLVQRADGGSVYGRGDRATPRRLPSDETGVAISEQWVASVIPSAAGTSTVRFRARDTGRTIIDVQVPIWVSAGAWSTAGLVVTGYGDAAMKTDGGLVLVSPEAPTATVLVAGGPFSARLGDPVARGDVVVSPSGRIVAANACGLRLCDAQVVDLGTGATSRPIQAAEGFLRVLTDDAIVTTDDDFEWISARRIADGTEIWRRRDSILLDPIATDDGSVIAVTGSPRSGWGVASIDARGVLGNLGPRSTGNQAWPRIWTALSRPSTVVIAATPFAEWLGTGGSLPLTVLGVDGGRSTASATSIDLPVSAEWMR
jgi:hypothetical protein